MALNISNRYNDIIHLSRPASKHPHMSQADRAKIFSPFAALKGHTEAIQRKEIPRVNKILLSDEMTESLERKMTSLKKGQTITLTYFFPDYGSDGAGGMAEGLYLTRTGTIQNIDILFKTLKIDDFQIKIEDIIDIT